MSGVGVRGKFEGSSEWCGGEGRGVGSVGVRGKVSVVWGERGKVSGVEVRDMVCIVWG